MFENLKNILSSDKSINIKSMRGGLCLETPLKPSLSESSCIVYVKGSNIHYEEGDIIHSFDKGWLVYRNGEWCKDERRL